MFGIREDLIVPFDGIDTDRMLEFWRWLIPETHRPLFATALGDLFLAEPTGRIMWLDIGGGRLENVAENEAEFRTVVTDPEKFGYWFGSVLVEDLRAAGKTLEPGECYCYITLPLLGGEYEPSNFRVYDVVTHFQVWGPIHEEIWNLPDGAQVEFEIG